MTQQARITRTARPQALMARPRSACPVCYSVDRVDRVSNVVRTGRGKLIWEDGETAHYETELSELLDEPPRPKPVSIIRGALGIVPSFIVLAAILGILSLIRAQDYVTVPPEALKASRNIALAWFAVVVPGVLVVRFLQARGDHDRELPIWTLARRRWSGLYYCSRDDVVFSEQSDQVASPAEMSELLYDKPEPITPAQELALPKRSLRAAK